jgi:hypothetical protein
MLRVSNFCLSSPSFCLRARGKTWSLCAFLVLAFSAPVASENPSEGQPASIGPLHLEPVRQLRKDVDLWPLLVHPATPGEQRINATLERLNRSLEKALGDCDRNYLSWAKQTGNESKTNATGVWTRTVEVTMNSARFLSLVAREELYCGGAHPDEDRMAMVFDRTTGRPMNWTAAFPPSAGASHTTDTVADGSLIGALVLPAMMRMLLDAADAECKEAFLDPQGFVIWPDAKRRVLVAEPFDLPHAAQVCVNEIDLTMGQARALGFDEALLRAIEEAHREAASSPPPQ